MCQHQVFLTTEPSLQALLNVLTTGKKNQHKTSKRTTHEKAEVQEEVTDMFMLLIVLVFHEWPLILKYIKLYT